MSRMESAEGYDGLVVQLNRDWRVIECRDRNQWILQRRGSPNKHVRTIGVVAATAEPLPVATTSPTGKTWRERSIVQMVDIKKFPALAKKNLHV
jgi:hypothetical protein